MQIIPVVLCGGVGARLWPASNALKPKPFIKLNDGLNFLQKTYLRIAKIPQVNHIVTITNRSLLFQTTDSFNDLALKNIDHHTCILEPIGRNTAPAIATAILHLQKEYPNAILLVVPADHIIHQEDLFIQKVEQAIALAQQQRLVTFGIQPNYPETGYGYIEFEHDYVKRFVEKPDEMTAQYYVNSGKFLWNSGMLCFSIATMINEFSSYSENILQIAKKSLQQAIILTNKNFTSIELALEEFQNIPNISIDYAIMEKTSIASVIACDIGWNDVGCWNTLGDLMALNVDNDNNHINGNVYLYKVKHSTIIGNKKIIGVVGLDNIVVVDCDDGLLIVNKNNTQDVKTIYGKILDNVL